MNDNTIPEPQAQPVDTEIQENNTQNASTEQVENPYDVNWKKFREAREVERKQRDEAQKRAAEKAAEAEALRIALEAALNKRPANSVDNSRSQYEEEETEDQRIQKKVDAALAIKEKQYEEQRRIREQQEFPQKLNSTYRDFDKVCSSDNLDYLEFHHPEISKAFQHMPDGFDKWATIYQAVKKYVPNSDNKKDQSKAEKNFNKPQAMSVPGATQTGDSPPMRLDDKRRADNWARMQRIMKGGK